MKLSGSLEKNKLSDIFRDAKDEKATGILAIKSQEGFGTIHFSDGAIVGADSPVFRERLGRRLTEKGILSEKDLRKSLMYQKKDGKDQRIGDILVKYDFITREDLNIELREIMKDTLYSMLFWDGIYRFESSDATEINEGFSIEIDEFLDDLDKSFTEIEDGFLVAELEKDSTWQQTEVPEKTSVKDEIMQSIENVTQSISSFSPMELVVLVEDERLMRTIFSDGLANFGYQVESFDNPTDALERIKTFETTRVSPVLVLDLVMPGLSSVTDIYGGLELLTEINQNFPHIPVIIMTSLVDSEIRLKSLFMGASYYLNKPDKSFLSSQQLRSGLDQFVEELSLCVENIFRNKRMSTEKEQLAFIREQLISELLDAKLELGSAEKEIERDIFDLTYLKKTTYDLMQKQNFDFISDTILSFLKIDHIRGFIGIIRGHNLKFYKGFTKNDDDNIKALNKKPDDFSVGSIELESFEEVITSNKVYIGEVTPKDADIIQKNLGGYKPASCLIVPFRVYGKPVALLYCDDETEKMPSKNMDQIQVLCNAASLAMQITILNEKISQKKGH